MEECKIEECSREVYYNDKCLLHCEKDDFFDKNNEFNKAIEEYPQIEENNLKFKGIFFPKKYDYSFIWSLYKGKRISFWYCTFYEDTTYKLDKQGDIYPEMLEADVLPSRLCFYNSIFNEKWIHIINLNYVYYSECTFNDEIYFAHPESVSKDVKMKKLEFQKCMIEKSFNLHYSKNSICEIEQIDIQNTTFKSEFLINNSIIENISLFLNTFESIVELNENRINVFDCSQSKFNGITTFTGTTFKSIKFKAIVFDKLVIFNNIKIKNILDLKGITFRDEANFLEMKNIKEGKLETKNIENRETARIIKHSLDKVGNIIEANKFYTLEMEHYKKELDESKESNIQEKFIFWMNKTISNFGQSWILPIFWIFIITMVFIIFSGNIGDIKENKKFFHYIYNYKYYFELFVILQAFIISICIVIYDNINKIFGYLYLLISILIIYLFHFNFDLILASQVFGNYMSIPNMHPSFENDVFYWFLHKALLSILIYNLTVALRRQTRR
jgi:hypothetical protein